MKSVNYPNWLIEKAKEIKLLALDMDGILTDGKLSLSANDIHTRHFYALDGYGLKFLASTGVQTAIITASPLETLVQSRARDLSIKYIVMNRFDKWNALKDILASNNIEYDQCAFIGDDWPDIKPIYYCGLGISVPNAHPLVKKYSDYITVNSSSEGAVREITDLIMLAQNTMKDILSNVLPDKLPKDEL